MPPLLLPSSTNKPKNILKIYKTSKDNLTDLSIRNYKFFNYVDLNLTLHPLNPALKSKIFRSLQTSKFLRKFKIDDDSDTESSTIPKSFHQILKHNSQSLTSLSNYILNDEISPSFSSKLRHFLIKLKSLKKYKSFSLSPRDINLVQRHLKSLDLVSSKFSGTDFKKAVSYLLSHKSSYSTLQELFLTFRLSRDRENILDLLPVLLQSPRFKQIRLALLYAKNLPNFNNTISTASRAKVRELALLIDDSHSMTMTIPDILTFHNLESLSISNPFRGFSVNPENCTNWKAFERFTNLKKFSLELNDDTRDVESLAMLLGYLSLPARLEVLKLCFRYFPFESLIERYFGCLEKFAQGVKGLQNLFTLSLIFESEKSRRINEVIELFDMALKDKGRLKEVCIGFPEPRYKTNGVRCHGVLDISRLVLAISSAADTLETLEIESVKGEMKELRENVRFTNLKKVKIGVDENMNESNRLVRFLEMLPEEKLRILELNLKTYVALEDIIALERFKKLEVLRISILGEVMGDCIRILRATFLGSKELKEISLELPGLDIREENQVEEMMVVLMNKKELRKISIKTKYLKYAFDCNLDGRTREQNNEHRKMIRFVH